MKSDFVHLHVHSHASFLNSSARVDAIIKRAKELNMPAVALTDYGNVFNAIPFYEAAKKADIKPILGCDFFFIEDCEESRVSKVRTAYNIALLAESNEGWHNILRLVNASNTGGNFYYRPRIDFSLLEQFSEGVICIAGGLNSPISKYLYDDTDEDGSVRSYTAIPRAEAMIRRFLKIFDADHFWLETQDNQEVDHATINGRLRQLATKHGIKTVAGIPVHYIAPSNAEAHRTLRRMTYNPRARNIVAENNEWLHFLSSDDMQELDFTAEELANTIAIANRCDVEIDLKQTRLPSYPYVPDGITSDDHLDVLALQGLQERGLTEEQYQDRLKRELSDIHKMGFADYFLLVADVVGWTKAQGILVGPGRGSAGGSLVSYCLRITNIDPLKHGLIWERFLNVDRVGLPDIDIDVPRSKRGQVLDYIRERFGASRVAQLVTFNKLAARAALKDVFRAYDVPFDEANHVTSLVPAKDDDHTAIKLDRAIEKVPELQKLEKRYHCYFQIARDLEGCYRGLGTHASAVMIADKSLDEGWYPLCRAADAESLLFGWDMETVDKLKLLKLDILGLSTLDVIQDTFDLVQERYGVTLTLDDIDAQDNDPAVFELFAKGHLVGVFQLEKQLGRIWSKAIQPCSVSEISDLVSIIRPGPLDCLSQDTKILVDRFNHKSEHHSSFRYLTVEELYNRYQRVRHQQYGGRLGCPPSLKVYSINESSHGLVRNKIKRVVKSGRKKLYNIVVQTDCAKRRPQRASLDIKASAGHRFLTLSGWKRLKDITPGDYVCILKKNVTNKKSNRHAQGWRNFKDIAFQHYKYECIFCDWDQATLDVNHTKGNRFQNNEPSNLSFMCPNHHRLYTDGLLGVEDIEKARKTKKLPNTDDFMYCRVLDIVYASTEPTYDIEMEEPYHNFIAGDFVVHNSGMAKTYRNVKMGESDPEYIHNALEPILTPTYSACLYQEQVIEICKQLANMTGTEADNVRKAMGKKKPEDMRKWSRKFQDGCTKSDLVSGQQAQDIWEFIDKFSGYGFNRSHGIGYAKLAYYTAFLKTYYPIEFFCACLRSASHAPDTMAEIKKFVNDAKMFNIDIRPPKATRGNVDFDVAEDKQIVFGLSALKNIGVKAIPGLTRTAKMSHGMHEFIWNTIINKVNRRVVESAIKGGALDYFSTSRSIMWATYELLSGLTEKERELIAQLKINDDAPTQPWTQFVKQIAEEEASAKLKEEGCKIPNVRRRTVLRDLLQQFDGADIFDGDVQRIAWERQYLGTALSGNEADAFRAKHSCREIAMHMPPGSEVEFAMTLDEVRTTKTRTKGEDMAFLTGEDHTYRLDNIVVFPETYRRCRLVLESGYVLKVIGTLNERGSIVARRIQRLK